MRINLIAAVAQNGVIGKDNALPWRLRADLQYFKKVTLGFPVVMGRKTYESIGRPLPGRLNIVVSRQVNWRAEGVHRVGSVEEAIALVESHATSELFIIGGAQLYQQSLAFVDCLYITRVNADVDGDAFFPEYAVEQWYEASRESHYADDANQYDYDFIVYNKH